MPARVVGTYARSGSSDGPMSYAASPFEPLGDFSSTATDIHSRSPLFRAFGALGEIQHRNKQHCRFPCGTPAMATDG